LQGCGVDLDTPQGLEIEDDDRLRIGREEHPKPLLAVAQGLLGGDLGGDVAGNGDDTAERGVGELVAAGGFHPRVGAVGVAVTVARTCPLFGMGEQSGELGFDGGAIVRVDEFESVPPLEVFGPIAVGLPSGRRIEDQVTFGIDDAEDVRRKIHQRAESCSVVGGRGGVGTGHGKNAPNVQHGVEGIRGGSAGLPCAGWGRAKSFSPPAACAKVIRSLVNMIVAVHPLAGFDKVLHYRAPETFCAGIAVGSLVRVPVVNRFTLAVVSQLDPTPDCPVEKLKNVAELVYPFPALTPELLSLARWIAAYYAAPLDTVIAAMIPVSGRKGLALKIEKRLAVARELSVEELETLNRRAPQQAKLYAFLKLQLHPVAKPLALERLKVGPSSVAALVKHGVLREIEHRIERVAYGDEIGGVEPVAVIPPELNLAQKAAVDSIRASGAKGGFAVHLLQGVTGSGKTEVYLHAIADMLQGGGGAVYLVPEVALTPQTVARLRGRLEQQLGQRVVVWHSSLSEGERLDGWLALASGQARIVVGARSAVFAPVRDLRLVIVDEEHEPAYKQDETPRYHGRDVAVYRAKLAGAVCVLGSATPSVESVNNVRRGRYLHDTLPTRIDDRKLPRMHIVDMRHEIVAKRATSVLSVPRRRSSRSCSSTAAATPAACCARSAAMWRSARTAAWRSRTTGPTRR